MGMAKVPILSCCEIVFSWESCSLELFWSPKRVVKKWNLCPWCWLAAGSVLCDYVCQCINQGGFHSSQSIILHQVSWERGGVRPFVLSPSQMRHWEWFPRPLPITSSNAVLRLTVLNPCMKDFTAQPDKTGLTGDGVTRLPAQQGLRSSC